MEAYQAREEISQARETYRLDLMNQAVAEFSEFTTPIRQYHDEFQRVGAALLEKIRFETPQPDESLLDTNPTEYQRQRIRYEKAAREYQDLAAKIENSRKASEELEQQRQHTEYVRSAAVLQQRYPEFLAPETGQQELARLLPVMEAAGYTREQVMTTIDHRLILMARAAAKLAELEADTKPKTKPRASNAAPKPGPRQGRGETPQGRGKDTAAFQAFENVMKTGSLRGNESVWDAFY